MEQENRVVVLIDMDCFYCQVEEKLNPELKGKPIAVVQYNPWKGGGIIAVNYVARAKGVTRHMRGDEAKEKCPEIELPSVPCLRGKADISKYRDAGKEVARVLQKFTPLLERASIDEAYLDITTPVQERLKTLDVNMVTTDLMPNTYALGYDSVEEFLADVHSCGFDNIDFDYEHSKRLLVGAVIVSEIRAAVYEETGYRCSAGIAHNKILAKLVCGMNKPNKQTVLPKHSINLLYKTLSLKKVKHLGGKFGDNVCEVLKVTKMGELQSFSEKELQTRFDDKNGTWLYNIAHGIDLEPVQARFNPKSIGCCKQFKGKAALLDLDSLRRWLRDLADEVDDRLEKDALENNRTPRQMVVSFSTQMPDGKDTSSSRSYNFLADDELCGDKFADKALELLLESAEGAKVKDGEANRRLKAPIKFLGISVGKFEDQSEVKKVKKILDYFGAGSSKETQSDRAKNIKKEIQAEDVDKKKNTKHSGKEYIMQKFFQVTPKTKDTSIKQEGFNNNLTNDDNTKPKPDEPIENVENKPVLEATLDKQESFFAKMLNSALPKHIDIEKQSLRPTTPVCDVVKCGEDSNDSEYSNSTINHEINKSIALFEEDPHDISRVSSIRQLLNTSKIVKDDDSDRTTMSETDVDNDRSNDENAIKNSEQNVSYSSNQVKNDKPHPSRPPDSNTFECPDCNKIIPITMVEEHSDYHLALKLRDEERQEFRKELQNQKETRNKQIEVGKKKAATEVNKNESVASIASFLVKIDDNVPSEICSECGKRVPLEKFSEHLDYHEAKKLSRELNKRGPVISESTVKRKRKSISPVKKNKMPCRPIDSFFR